MHTDNDLDTDDFMSNELEFHDVTLDHAARVNAQHNEISQLYHDHNDKLVGFLANKLNSKQEALEVAQEAYVHILRLDEPQVISHLRAFLYKTALNIAIDRLRQRVRRQDIDDRIAPPRESHEESPDMVLEATQLEERLREILGELPAKCRMAFMMYKFKDMGYLEIAACMGLTESMVRKHVRRALAYCKNRLAMET